MYDAVTELNLMWQQYMTPWPDFSQKKERPSFGKYKLGDCLRCNTAFCLHSRTKAIDGISLSYQSCSNCGIITNIFPPIDEHELRSFIGRPTKEVREAVEFAERAEVARAAKAKARSVARMMRIREADEAAKAKEAEADRKKTRMSLTDYLKLYPRSYLSDGFN